MDEISHWVSLLFSIRPEGSREIASGHNYVVAHQSESQASADTDAQARKMLHEMGQLGRD
jgi:hypothetical protein